MTSRAVKGLVDLGRTIIVAHAAGLRQFNANGVELCG
jgi:hypothetical protein